MKKLILISILYSPFGGWGAFAQTQNTVIDPNFVQIPRLSTAPTCATNDKGKLYFNNTDNKMYFCNGSAWVDFSNGGFTLPYSGIGNSNSTLFDLFNSTTSSAPTAQFGSTGTGFTVKVNNSNPNPANQKALQTVGGLRFIGIGEGANKILTSDASGNATWQSNGAFFVTRNSDVSIPNGTETQIVFNSENYDPDNNYLSSGKFFAPRDGLYHFDATIDWTAAFSASRVYLQIKHFDTIGNVKRVATQFVESSGQEPHISCSATFLMLGSETVEVRVFQNSGSARSIESTASTYFSGYLVRGN
jgi:hypothetical protein